MVKFGIQSFRVDITPVGSVLTPPEPCAYSAAAGIRPLSVTAAPVGSVRSIISAGRLRRAPAGLCIAATLSRAIRRAVQASLAWDRAEGSSQSALAAHEAQH